MTKKEYNDALHKLDDYKRERGYLSKLQRVDFIESVIAVEGHAWCMDNKSERRKMSKLIISILDNLK